MEERHQDSGQAQQWPSNSSSWGPDIIEQFGSVSLASQEAPVSHREVIRHSEQDELSSQTASQILWSSGMLSQPVPDGFYSVIPDKKLREMFDRLPTLEELSSLEAEGLKADIIFVDTHRDKKLFMLKQLITTLVKGLNSNPVALIKKIAGLVCDLCKHPNKESSLKAFSEETFHASVARGVQMLGQIKYGSCRPRAILFKVLADTVGLESQLVVGFPDYGGVECTDSYKHMSVVVVLNSVELLVDLEQFPGQLIPRSARAIFLTHISAAGESDSAENDSCDSPIEPNSPLYGFAGRVDQNSVEKHEPCQFGRKFHMDASGLSLKNRLLRSATTIDQRMSEPDIAASFWRRSRKKIFVEPQTANSSPGHPSLGAHGRSMLGGDRKSLLYCADDAGPSRSTGAPASEARRLRRRSISITPEIGDDIVRAVRAMNETLKENRILREHCEDRSLPTSPSNGSCGASPKTNGKQTHKAMSLPTSPHEYISQRSGTIGVSEHAPMDKVVSTWNNIMETCMYHDKSLLLYDEWNIDFSELTVGTRVGIGFFGEVFRGTWNGTDVAIKVFFEQDLTPENMEDFCNEIAILSRLRHPNVILFLGACTKPPRLSMITEYMEMGSLYYLIHLSGQKKLSWRRRLKMLCDICRGLMCIHRMKIVHRDLKSANCLVSKHWTVKICDFGLSRVMSKSPIRDTCSAGTPEWMAPELIRNEPFSEKCDIFSLGVIMWELCTLSRPWGGMPLERVVNAVSNEGSRLDIPEGPLGQLIAECWAEPEERPNCEDILSRLLDCEYELC